MQSALRAPNRPHEHSMNSKLFHNENGWITLNSLHPCDQAVTARFDVNVASVQAAEVFVLAKKADESTPALALTVNGQTYALNSTMTGPACWLRAQIDAAVLQQGSNEFTVPVQPQWAMAYEPAGGQPVIRARLWHDSFVAEPIFPVYGDPGIETQRDEWLALLPESLRVVGDRWQWCWELAGFLSSAWPYSNELDGGSAYAPWDARTILNWGKAGCDPSGEKCIAMCVHYAVCFVQFCVAMGVPARAIILTSDVNTPSGHFVTEVWLEEYQAWALIDPNLHLCYQDPDTGCPLSAAELARLQDEPRALAQLGEGFQSQKIRLGSYLEEVCLPGDVYRHWGVWQRHDWIARPDLVPPQHGTVLYAETDIIWCADTEEDVAKMGMFSHFLSAAQLAVVPNS